MPANQKHQNTNPQPRRSAGKTGLLAKKHQNTNQVLRQVHHEEQKKSSFFWQKDAEHHLAPRKQQKN